MYPLSRKRKNPPQPIESGKIDTKALRQSVSEQANALSPSEAIPNFNDLVCNELNENSLDNFFI